ncbi:hypothetical protein E2C01_072167 [Portunus trituberculatus]|uniref:Uncharacterized protein n=1 Tax=Portunus trituberculatus TaxID=210409 RepID=A0A5B7I6G0_PORTR|nr:hypothetical protein [Portunus trituberculatus]
MTSTQAAPTAEHSREDTHAAATKELPHDVRLRVSGPPRGDRVWRLLGCVMASSGAAEEDDQLGVHGVSHCRDRNLRCETTREETAFVNSHGEQRPT